MTALPAVSTLELNLADGWLQIRFNRPEARNALNDALVADVMAICDAVREDRAVRGISLRGNGGVFCAGGDLKGFHAINAAGDQARDMAYTLSVNAGQFFRTLDTMPQITVSLVEGAAMAGGFGVASATDLCFGTKDAKLCLTETLLGLSPAQIAPYVVKRVGPAKARHLMLTAMMLDGATAKAFGIFDELAEDAAALSALEQQLKAQVLRCAPVSVARTKAVLSATGTLEPEALIAFAADTFADCIVGAEGREGIAAFVEKRTPNWVA